MGSMLALAAAPAIVRASSLMQVASFDWTKYVREIVQYSISDDCMVARWDILSPTLGQFHCDIKLESSLADWNERSPIRDNLYVSERKMALDALRNEMVYRNISPRALVHLELPVGMKTPHNPPR